MSRNLDSTLSAALSAGSILPALLTLFQFKSGTLGAWSGIGDLEWNGNTYKGVGQLGKISVVSEGSNVQADGMSVQLLGLPLSTLGDAGGSVPSDTVAPAVGGGGLVGAFTDASGVVLEPVALGDGPATLTVPNGATQLQLGVDAAGWASNTGSWMIAVSVNGGAASDVTVPGTAMPWDPSISTAYPLTDPDGTAPVVGATGLKAGDTVTVTYVSGTVTTSYGSADANGTPTPSVSNASGSVTKNVSSSVGPFEAAVEWSNFSLTSSLPADAAIEGIYPVVVASAAVSSSIVNLCYGTGLLAPDGNNHPLGGSGFDLPSGQSGSFASTEFYTSASLGTDLSVLNGQKIGAGLFATLNAYWGPGFDTLNVTAVAFAVLYSSATAPSGTPQLPNPFTPAPGQYFAWAVPGAVESSGTQSFSQFPFGTTGSQTGSGTVAAAPPTTPRSYMGAVAPPSSYLSDVQMGAPVSIYFALFSGGALLGTPYLVWRGMVDQPSIDVSADTFSVTLSLENALTNLARATMRRYTAADQRLAYPDDIGFNWVETLNDIALRWGS